MQNYQEVLIIIVRNEFLKFNFLFINQYLVKVIIRGDRNTGKTAIWHMLQRKRFTEEYIPTKEIQAATIDWGFKRL